MGKGDGQEISITPGNGPTHPRSNVDQGLPEPLRKMPIHLATGLVILIFEF
jgi:hypothetical protein